MKLTVCHKIWFQNRRQNIRRRSRPLSPHEVGHRTTTNPGEQSLEKPQREAMVEGSSPRSTQDENTKTDAEREEAVAGEPEVPTHTQPSASPRTEALQDSSSQKIPTKEVEVHNERPRRSLKRSLSGKRLSMTSEGGARLLNDDESSPSPPRPVPELIPSLSANAPVMGSLTTVAGGLCPGVRKPPSGRSRDSRAWEFCCDSDARDELALKAEQEHTGSAATAIKLVRSSSRRALEASAKSPALRTGHSATADKPSQPPLKRSKTSDARLETRHAPSFHLHADELESAPTSLLSSRFDKSPSGESDKENNDGETRQSQPVKRPVLGEKNHSNARSLKPRLKASSTVPSRKPGLKASSTVPSSKPGLVASSLDQRRNRLRKSNSSVGASKENINPEDDDEIARFMGGSKQRSNLSIEEEQDMDVIQGLLSLSKG